MVKCYAHYSRLGYGYKMVPRALLCIQKSCLNRLTWTIRERKESETTQDSILTAVTRIKGPRYTYEQVGRVWTRIGRTMLQWRSSFALDAKWAYHSHKEVAEVKQIARAYWDHPDWRRLKRQDSLVYKKSDRWIPWIFREGPLMLRARSTPS